MAVIIGRPVKERNAEPEKSEKERVEPEVKVAEAPAEVAAPEEEIVVETAEETPSEEKKKPSRRKSRK